MKKILLSFVVLSSLIIGCKKTGSIDPVPAEEVQAIIHRSCAADEVLQAQLAADPSLRTRMEAIERFTDNAIQAKRLVNGVIEIPVVVNVLYNTAVENISQQQIQSQIDVLNADF